MSLTDFKFRGYTAAQWTALNYVLSDKEVGIEKDTLKEKVGDGVTGWNGLSYSSVDSTSNMDGGNATSTYGSALVVDGGGA